MSFKNFEALDSLKKLLNNSPIETLAKFESEFKFKSAYTIRKEFMLRADEMSETEISRYLDEVYNKGYFDKENQFFVYPFYNESYSKVLNEEGKVKIGKTIYQFEGTIETIVPDLQKTDFKGEIKPLRFNIDGKLPTLKGGEVLKSTMLSDNRLRCLLELKREGFVVQDWIIYNGEIVWGIVGHKWQIYYRFHSYKRYTLYQSDRPTYFNWKTQYALAGGNDDFWYQYYNNSNPPTERSTHETALYYHVTYDSGLIQSMYPVAVYSYVVSDFWSDYMMNFHGTLYYP